MQENWQHPPQTQQGSPPPHEGAVQRSREYGFGINVPAVPVVSADKDQRAWLLKFHRERDYARFRAGREQQMGAVQAATLIGDVNLQAQKEMVLLAHEHKHDIDWGPLLKGAIVLGVAAFLKWAWGESRRGGRD